MKRLIYLAFTSVFLFGVSCGTMLLDILRVSAPEHVDKIAPVAVLSSFLVAGLFALFFKSELNRAS